MQESQRIAGIVPVLLALAGNLVITLMKFAGFLASGSGALFSEAIHSLADTLNQTLLLIGVKSSRRNADREFSYGYGKERFFWALISACGIFFLGAGVTIYHGIELLLSQEEPHISGFLFVILFVSLVVESCTFAAAAWELKTRYPKKNIKEILRSGDPATIAVLYEDGVAVLGVIVALISITLTHLTGSAVWDAFGSIAIGCLLGGVAVALVRKNRKYLIGVTIPEEVRKRVIDIIESDSAIDRVIDFKSSVLDIGSYHVKCEVEFNGSVLIKTALERNMLKEEFEAARTDYEGFLRFLVDYSDRIPRLMGLRIDEIEKRIQTAVPEIRHIDIEIN
jgi:zinc transporter 9